VFDLAAQLGSAALRVFQLEAYQASTTFTVFSQGLTML